MRSLCRRPACLDGEAARETRVRDRGHDPPSKGQGGGRWIQVWNPVQAKAESGDAGDMEERFAKENQSHYIETGFEHEVYNLTVRDGQIFAASADGKVKQYDATNFTEVRAYHAGSDWLFGLDYSSSAHLMACGSFNGDVSIWNTLNGTKIITFKAAPGPNYGK